MKRLLAFLIIQLLFIFACEDEEETYCLDDHGFCDQITTSDEDTIAELKSLDYTKGTCDKSEAIAKCEYDSKDIDGVAYHYNSEFIEIIEFEELCTNDLGGTYEIFLDAKTDEETYYTPDKLTDTCDEYVSSNRIAIDRFEYYFMYLEKGSCYDKSSAIAKCVSNRIDDDYGYEYTVTSYLYSTIDYSYTEFKLSCENDYNGKYEKLSDDPEELTETAEPVTPGTDYDTALLIEVGTPVSSSFTESFYHPFFKI